MSAVEDLLKREFDVIERSDKSGPLVEHEQFGYASIHYLIRLSSARRALPEYQQFSGALAEVQVRTVLQHAWAESSHEIAYKSAETTPKEINRRFRRLAALLELADNDFQSIQNEDERLRREARILIKQRKFSEIEITPDAVKSYVFQRVGIDRRVRWDTFDYLARLLRRLGFKTVQELDYCIDGYDCDAIGQVVFGARLSSAWRLQAGLLAAMGELFVARHPLAEEREFQTGMKGLLKRLTDRQVLPRPLEQLPECPH